MWKNIWKARKQDDKYLSICFIYISCIMYYNYKHVINVYVYMCTCVCMCIYTKQKMKSSHCLVFTSTIDQTERKGSLIFNERNFTSF